MSASAGTGCVLLNIDWGNMKLFLLALAFLGIANLPGTSNSFSLVSGLVSVIVVLRILWLVWRNPSPVLRKTGEVAAKVANHMDSFKEAFKEGRNK